MTSVKTRVIGQLFISFGMALTMSGIMGFIALGSAYLPHWPVNFLTAWPIAFVLSMFVSPLAFKLAHRVSHLIERSPAR